MQKKLTLDEVKEMYPVKKVRHCETYFEITDERSGVTFAVPQEFDIFIDGKPMDPTRMLTVPRGYSMRSLLGFEFTSNPLYVKFLCGMYDRDDGMPRFWSVDSMATPGDPRMKVVLMRMHWDLRENANGVAWGAEMRQMFLAGEILYEHCDTDDYGVEGDWYWVIKPGWPPVGNLGDTGMFAVIFLQVMYPVMKMAEEEMQSFERNKAKYKVDIHDILQPLEKEVGWIIESDDDETVAQSGTKTLHYRHDVIGYSKCAKDFAFTLTEKA